MDQLTQAFEDYAGTQDYPGKEADIREKVKKALRLHTAMASVGTSQVDLIIDSDSDHTISPKAREIYAAVLGSHSDRFLSDKALQTLAIRLTAGGDAGDRLVEILIRDGATDYDACYSRCYNCYRQLRFNSDKTMCPQCSLRCAWR